MAQEIPMISKLLRSIIIDDYTTALKIVKGSDFNPNDTHLSWKAPVVSAIINVIGETAKISDEKSFRELLITIMGHEDFNPNMTDAEGETILMHIARHPRFCWLAPYMLANPKTNVSIENFMHRTAEDIAKICGNKKFTDIISGHANTIIKLPHKRSGIKKPLPKGNIKALNKIENAFYEVDKKEDISLYNLLKAFYNKKYTNCIEIINNAAFDPNECDKWGEPVISSLIYYSQECGVEYDEDKFKEIVNAIMALDGFNPNILDIDKNTPLMVAMQFKNLRWLAEKLFKEEPVMLYHKNYWGDDLASIAKDCGNEEFYNGLRKNTFKEANV